MEPPRTLASMAVFLAALSAPAGAQIITTALPPAASPGEKRDRFSAHLMVTPVAKWDYGEVFFGVDTVSSFFAYGTINGKPNSDFMVAGEIAVPLGNGHWSVVAGGWYNQVGSSDFDLDAEAFFAGLGFGGPLKAQLPYELSMYEAHVGVFYKAVGVQSGMVRTHTMSDGTLKNVQWTLVEGAAPIKIDELSVPGFAFDLNTTDWTVFGVLRHGTNRWGLSVGAGAYFKQGVNALNGENAPPLRSGESKVVFTGFLTANVRAYKALGIDASYWYVHKTDAIPPLSSGDRFGASRSSDRQRRWTVGLGLSF